MKFPHTISVANDKEAASIARDAQRSGDDAAVFDQAPHVVIRGESILTPSLAPKTAFLDYLAFTYRPEEPLADIHELKAVLIGIFNIPPYDWSKSKNGWQGYREKWNLDFYGFVAFGGTSQKGTVHIELQGHGCSIIQDWRLVHDFLITINARLTRVDVAHDDLEGKYINIENALIWEKEGLYHSSGRPPSTLLYDDRGSGKGKTYYIGCRQSSKYCRIYEKGRQTGDPNSPWCRVEVEYKSKDCMIPFDTLLQPEKYLAGSYKPFEVLFLEQSRIKSNSKAAQVALSKSIGWCLSVCGQLINLLCIINGDDYEKVIKLIRRRGIPPKLQPFYKRYLHERGVNP